MKDIDFESIGKKLKEIRLSKGLPQDAVASAAEVNTSHISNIENKRKMIGIMFKCLYHLIGYKRYVLFVKSLYNYCRPELHTFLIEKK